MNTYVELDRFKRGDILWIAHDLTGKGAYIPAQDPYNLNAIDPALVARLRRLLEITNEENWTAYGTPAEGFAKAISQALTDLSKPFHAIFETSPSFRIPELLRIALGISNTVIPVTQWLTRYPVN